MKKRITSEFSFEVWINNDIDQTADDSGLFDDNWMVSAADLFNGIELPAEESMRPFDEAA